MRHGATSGGGWSYPVNQERAPGYPLELAGGGDPWICRVAPGRLRPGRCVVRWITNSGVLSPDNPVAVPAQLIQLQREDTREIVFSAVFQPGENHEVFIVFPNGMIGFVAPGAAAPQACFVSGE